jgi:DNA-binding SARP family transcriptional activator/tetratricopeptide (TPR) repeat protein
MDAVTEEVVVDAAAARVRVLGPVEVTGLHGPAALVGARQRAIVGLLALKAGALVPQWRLVDALWGERPPRTAVKSLHSHVHRVRQALGQCGLPDVLVTRDTGYLLALERDSIDACRFEDEVRQGHQTLAAGAPEPAADQLRAGLVLWRDEMALAGIPLHDWGAAEVERLGEVRMAATVARWDAELRVGRHVEAVAELERLLVMHPLHEGLVSSLMLALYRSGRHTSALEVYQRLRVRLADELGVDPGPQLIGLHAQILGRDPALDLRDLVEPRAPSDRRPPTGHAAVQPMPRPAQLPARVGHFTGRDDALDALGALGSDPEIQVAVISGPGGMGKTALAVQWAHGVTDRFPDGQIFVDLRGREPGNRGPTTEALAHVLRSLGVPADRIPAEAVEQVSLYRSLLHDRRTLIVADNAPDVEGILPLVPPTAGNLLLVTSRSALPALSTHHAVCAVHLEALTDDEALALLRRLLGAAAVDAQRDAAAELVRLCDRMPLALRIAGAKLAGHGSAAIADLVDELLNANRLDVLTVDNDSRSVRTVFATAYRSLRPVTARAFRLMGLHPGPTFHTELVAAATDLPTAEARAVVSELVDVHLVAEAGARRYRFHDLIALFAAHCARIDETKPQRAGAVARIVDWYLAVAHAANRTTDPGRDRVTPALRYPPAGLPFAAEHDAALAFLDGERDNLLPVARFAARHQHPAATWQLTYLLTGFYDSHVHRGQRIELCEEGVAAAQLAGDPVAEGLMRSGLGVACIAAHRFDEALDILHSALPLMQASGDQRGEGHAYNNIAAAYSGLRRFDEAMEAFRRALSIHTASGNRLGIALALNNTGHTAVRMGRPDLGTGDLSVALALSREIGVPRLEAAVLHSIGEADLGSGAYNSALEHFHAALAVYRRCSDRNHEAKTLAGIGLTHLRRGEPVAALDVLGQALALSREIADQHMSAAVVHHIGRAMLSAGDRAGAEAHFTQSLALRTGAPDPYEEAHLHSDLAELAEHSGDTARAARHREQAVSLYRRVNAIHEADELAGRLCTDARPPDAPATGRLVADRRRE